MDGMSLGLIDSTRHRARIELMAFMALQAQYNSEVMLALTSLVGGGQLTKAQVLKITNAQREIVEKLDGWLDETERKLSDQTNG